MKKKGGGFFWGFMIKEEKGEKRGSVEFQVFSFTNKIGRLASRLKLHKKDFSSDHACEIHNQSSNYNEAVLPM
ncbi:hypothetical protein ZWY2020_054610 [Hordeum vulgare]|nr:hypothetical protein ZWY2020_054610 [Hordeum vulgare]